MSLTNNTWITSQHYDFKPSHYSAFPFLDRIFYSSVDIKIFGLSSSILSFMRIKFPDLKIKTAARLLCLRNTPYVQQKILHRKKLKIIGYFDISTLRTRLLHQHKLTQISFSHKKCRYIGTSYEE
jgi:hypothetical protein